MMLKSFSEGISCGAEVFAAPSPEKIAVAGKEYPLAKRILKNAAEGKPYYTQQGEVIPITRDMYNTAQTAIRNHIQFLQRGVEKIKALKYPQPIAAEKELQRLKTLIKAPFPTGKVPAKVAKPIAKKVAKEVIRRKGLKTSIRLLSKITKTILPWVGWGIVLSDLVRRGMKEVKAEKKAEGYGEYYHSKVGWY